MSKDRTAAGQCVVVGAIDILTMECLPAHHVGVHRPARIVVGETDELNVVLRYSSGPFQSLRILDGQIVAPSHERGLYGLAEGGFVLGVPEFLFDRCESAVVEAQEVEGFYLGLIIPGVVDSVEFIFCQVGHGFGFFLALLGLGFHGAPQELVAQLPGALEVGVPRLWRTRRLV